jgi:hypothetical protein
MPTPTREELKSNDRDGYMSRCIEQVKGEGTGLRHDAIVARCLAMWRQAKDAEAEFQLWRSKIILPTTANE